MEIPVTYRKAIGKYQTVEVNGLPLYPITVEEYEEFLTARTALEFMQQTMPVRYATMPLLAAYYAQDYDAVSNNESPTGLFYRVLLLLALALGIGKGKPAQDRVQQFQVVCDTNDHSCLKALRFCLNGEEIRQITPAQFTALRPIIAAQNGIEPPSESANPELVEAEQDIAQMQSAQLNVDFYTLRATMAALSHCDETEIDQWPILKFQQRQQAIQRAVGYIVCSISEGYGAKWKSGNPYPSLFYDRMKTENAALMPLGNFAGGAAAKAMQQ